MSDWKDETRFYPKPLYHMKACEVPVYQLYNRLIPPKAELLPLKVEPHHEIDSYVVLEYGHLSFAVRMEELRRALDDVEDFSRSPRLPRGTPPDTDKTIMRGIGWASGDE